jgi:preprotein translocase subunit SecB
MSDKDTKEKGKKKKTAAKDDIAAAEPTLDAPDAPANKAETPAKDADSPDEAVGVAPATPAPPAATASGPQIGIQSQYVKDLSFENPGAPGSLVGSTEPPDIQVNVEVQARALQAESYEVSLHITASGKNGQTTLFMLDLTYGAVCKVVGVPKDSLQPVLLVECPRLLFPFARRVLSDATRDGGFPPLMLNPIDFLSLYRQQQQQQSKAATSDKPTADA